MRDWSSFEEQQVIISKFNLIALKALTRLTFQPEIDDEIIDLIREMELEYDNLLRKYEILAERVNLDEKTSLLKYNETFLVNIIKTASRYWETSAFTHVLSISYMRLDLDDFSKINNRYGHDVGDKVLIRVAEVMKERTRPTDYLFRFGGEEFDIVLPATPLEGAEVCAEKLLNGIREIQILREDGESIRITASIGISSFKHDFRAKDKMISDKVTESYHAVQKQADCACYHAKYLGKDRYCLYNPNEDYKFIMREYSSRH